MSKHLEDFLKRNRELAEAATPGPWTLCEDGNQYVNPPMKWTGEMDGLVHACIVKGLPRAWNPWWIWHEDAKASHRSHGESRFAKEDAAFVSASRTSLPLALEMLEVACEALRKIGYTQDVSPADPETGGPCRIATANSRNRRILEAQEALAALEAKAKESL